MTGPQLPDGYGFVDSPGEQGNPVPLTTDLECVYCGTGIMYAGTGSKPKYCEEHKTAKSRKEPETPRPVGRPSGRALKVNNAIESLEFVYKIVGTGIGYVDPVASATVTEAAPKLAGSYRRMLETNDKFLKLFESADEKMAWLPIVITHGQLIMAIVASKNGISVSPEQTTEPLRDPYFSNVYDFKAPPVEYSAAAVNDVPIV